MKEDAKHDLTKGSMKEDDVRSFLAKEVAAGLFP